MASYRLEPTYNGYLCPDDPGEPGSGTKRWSVNATEARIVSELCRGLRVLEIGTGLGVSTKEIAKRADWVYTVDIDPWVKETIVPTLPRNTTFFDDIKKIPVRNLDAAFIDGLHTYAQCMKDIAGARELVKPGGLFIFHDMKISAVAKAVADSRLEGAAIGTSAGMAVAW